MSENSVKELQVTAGYPEYRYRRIARMLFLALQYGRQLAESGLCFSRNDALAYILAYEAQHTDNQYRDELNDLFADVAELGYSASRNGYNDEAGQTLKTYTLKVLSEYDGGAVPGTYQGLNEYRSYE